MNLRRRVDALERQLSTAPTILEMPEGQMATIPGSARYLHKLLVAAVRGDDLSPQQSMQLELIRRCTYAIEPSGSRLIEAIQLFLHGPAPTRSDEENVQDGGRHGLPEAVQSGDKHGASRQDGVA